MISACRPMRPTPTGMSATSGIDLYENGNLLAGYSYRTVAECWANLPQVLRTYLR
jgi:hypothetical protein